MTRQLQKNSIDGPGVSHGSQSQFRKALSWIIVMCVGLCSGCAVATRPLNPAKSAELRGPAPGWPSLGDLVSASSLPARDEELWIIEKPDVASRDAATASELSPGGGMLLAIRGATLTPLPLEQTDVRADIDGIIASVDVHQRFANASKEPTDVLYTFPLPQNGAVSEFVMSIGRRHIRGILRERAEAEQIFREARSQGLLASLMVQRAPNVFAQRVANLQPAAQVDVEIRYFHTIPFRDGAFEFEFPMIAGVRGREIPRPDQRNGRNVSLAVHLNAGVPIQKVESPSHAMTIKSAGGVVDAVLEPADKIPNRDLVLRYQLAADHVQASLVTERNGDGGAFSLLLIPPANLAAVPLRPLEVIIDIDPGVGPAANVPATAVLRCLSPRDSFQVVRAVPGSATRLFPAPAPADPGRVDEVCGTLTTLSSVGAPPGAVLTEALSQPHEAGRQHVVCLITDGHGSPRDILSAIAGHLGPAGMVVIGVGPSPDRDTIETIARAGHGVAVYLPNGDASGEKLLQLMESLSHPALSKLELDFNGGPAIDLFPESSPDLFVGHPVSLVGRYRGRPPQSLTLRGKVGNETRTWTVDARSAAALPDRSPIVAIWARRKIAQLAADAITQPNPSLDRQVRDLALEYGLLSRYTAFIAVDAVGQPMEAKTGAGLR